MNKKEYCNFIEKEGRLIAKLIDQGKSFREIRQKLSKEHSGNTYAWAFELGISHAWSDNAIKVKKAFYKSEQI